MLQVYRIANPLYIHDVSGEGARLRGGRWNEAGTPALYMASSIALAAWEVRVHLPNNIVPREDAFALAHFSIPESSILHVCELMSEWKSNERYTKGIGEAWIRDGKFLAMRVPSSIIEGECNYIINPAHELAAAIKLDQVFPFVFDTRTFIS